MKLIKRRNYNPGFPTFFDDIFTKDLFGHDRDLHSFKSNPAVNIIERDDHFSIELAAPGLTKKDFNIEMDNDLLTISFEKKEEAKEENDEKENTVKYTRREFRYTSFKRSFTIPEGSVDGEKISANYENGILTLGLPKREEAKAKARRTIKIG